MRLRGRVVLPSSPLRSSLFQGVCLVLFVVLGRQVGICSPTEREVIQQAKKFFYTEFAIKNEAAADAKITGAKVSVRLPKDMDKYGVKEILFIVDLQAVTDVALFVDGIQNVAMALLYEPKNDKWFYLATGFSFFLWGQKKEERALGSSIRLADLTEDGVLEIIIVNDEGGGSAHWESLLVFSKLISGWAKILECVGCFWYWGSNATLPLVFNDLDGDGLREILVEDRRCVPSDCCCNRDKGWFSFFRIFDYEGNKFVELKPGYRSRSRHFREEGLWRFFVEQYRAGELLDFIPWEESSDDEDD